MRETQQQAGGDHALAVPADDHWDGAQLRAVGFLDGSVEGVGIDTGDSKIVEFLMPQNTRRAAGRVSQVYEPRYSLVRWPLIPYLRQSLRIVDSASRPEKRR